MSMPNIIYTAGQDIKKGDRVEITQGCFVFPVFSEEKKEEIIIGCLKYCLHRKRSHPECGLAIKETDIQKVLDEKLK